MGKISVIFFCQMQEIGKWSWKKVIFVNYKI